jgi:hypothetical protein
MENKTSDTSSSLCVEETFLPVDVTVYIFHRLVEKGETVVPGELKQKVKR